MNHKELEAKLESMDDPSIDKFLEAYGDSDPTWGG